MAYSHEAWSVLTTYQSWDDPPKGRVGITSHPTSPVLCLEAYGEALELEDLGEAVMKEMTRQADRGDVFLELDPSGRNKKGAGVIKLAAFFWWGKSKECNCMVLFLFLKRISFILVHFLGWWYIVLCIGNRKLWWWWWWWWLWYSL